MVLRDLSRSYIPKLLSKSCVLFFSPLLLILISLFCLHLGHAVLDCPLLLKPALLQICFVLCPESCVHDLVQALIYHKRSAIAFYLRTCIEIPHLLQFITLGVWLFLQGLAAHG